MKPSEVWEHELNRWAIPEEILAQAPANPWIHPPTLFKVDPNTTPTELSRSPSTDAAIEALQRQQARSTHHGTVLDVGCGGGGSCVALSEYASLIIGVDEQRGMLTNFEQAISQRNVRTQTIEGKWPDVEGQTPIADVVVCHHVVYNVSLILPFIRALNTHARLRVVIELPATHPTSPFSPLWQHFWNIERPTQPTAHDFVAVLEELGIHPTEQRFTRPSRKASVLTDDYVAFVRQRLCLSSEKDEEVRQAIQTYGPLSNDEVVTVYWDREPAQQLH
jgi:SAM-dependent methyltransferase